MNFRVTNAPTSNHLADWVQISQQRASMAEQQLATGKRIISPRMIRRELGPSSK